MDKKIRRDQAIDNNLNEALARLDEIQAKLDNIAEEFQMAIWIDDPVFQ